MFFLIFRERGKERDRERETLMIEKHHQLAAPTGPLIGIEPATEACALTGSRTSDLLVPGLKFNHWTKLAGLKQQIFNENLLQVKNNTYVSIFGFIKKQKFKFEGIVSMPNLDGVAYFKRPPVRIVTWMTNMNQPACSFKGWREHIFTRLCK